LHGERTSLASSLIKAAPQLSAVCIHIINIFGIEKKLSSKNHLILEGTGLIYKVSWQNLQASLLFHLSTCIKRSVRSCVLCGIAARVALLTALRHYQHQLAPRRIRRHDTNPTIIIIITTIRIDEGRKRGKVLETRNLMKWVEHFVTFSSRDLERQLWFSKQFALSSHLSPPSLFLQGFHFTL
jgi:hypothetical protein